jgi:hypothetical protein
MTRLPDRLKSALEKMDEGRFRAMNKIRTMCGMGKEISGSDLENMIDRKNALVILKQQAGWRVVLERVAARKDQVFAAWMHGKSGNEAELKARVAELEDLLQWVEGEIAAGETAELTLQDRDGRK